MATDTVKIKFTRKDDGTGDTRTILKSDLPKWERNYNNGRLKTFEILKENSSGESIDQPIEVGDLINPKGFYGDIWLEVIKSFDDMVSAIQYSKYGEERWDRLFFINEISEVKKKEDIPEEKTDGTYHLVNGKFGPFGRNYPWKHNYKGGYHSNRPEKNPHSKDTKVESINNFETILETLKGS